MSLRNAGVHARGSRGGYSVLVSGNSIGNERPVTAAILFFENRSIFNLFRAVQFMLTISNNKQICIYLIFMYYIRIIFIFYQ